MPNLFHLFNLVFSYKQRSYHEEISEKTTIANSDAQENNYWQNGISR